MFNAYAFPRPPLTQSQERFVLERHYSGCLVEGHKISIKFVPMASGMIGVSVIGHPPLTGLGSSCLLGNERPGYFGLSDINLSSARLVCMVASYSTETYCEGFSVALEPGMADVIRPALEPLGRIAARSAAIVQRMDALKLARAPDGGSYLHMHDFAASVVARIVLDLQSPETATREEALDHFAGNDAEFMADFADDQVQRLLSTAGSPSSMSWNTRDAQSTVQIDQSSD